MTATALNVAAAQDALTRSDHGHTPQPGDNQLTANYEAFCQQAWDRHQHAQHEADRAEWLAAQCPACEPGGTGQPCDQHWDGADT